MTLYVLLKQLCGDYGLPVPRRRERYKVTIDSDIALFLYQEVGQADIVLSAAIGSVPDGNHLAVFQRLLETNHQEVLSKRCFFSFDPRHQQVVMSCWMADAAMGYGDFLQVLRDFIQQIRWWRSEIEKDFAEVELSLLSRLSEGIRV